MIVLKYVLCIHCYYTPEVTAAVYFSSHLSHSWTELMKKYSKVSMKCLSLPALHIICQDNFFFGCMNLHSLRRILQELYWTVNCTHDHYLCRGAATASNAWYLAWYFFQKLTSAATSVRIKKINEVVHPSGNLLKRVPPEMYLVNCSPETSINTMHNINLQGVQECSIPKNAKF